MAEERLVVVVDTDGDRSWHWRSVGTARTEVEALELAEKVAVGVDLRAYAATIARVEGIDAESAAALMVDPRESPTGELSYLVRVPAERPVKRWERVTLLGPDRTTEHSKGYGALSDAAREAFESWAESGNASGYVALTRREYELVFRVDEYETKAGVESTDVLWEGFER